MKVSVIIIKCNYGFIRVSNMILNTSSNGCDTSNSNRSDTSSSITSVTLIKQYKNKKRNIYKDF